MKQAFISLIIFTSTLLLLNSCEYRLKDEYYRDVDKPGTANIEVSLNDIDTAFNVIGNMTLQYTATTGNLEILYIKCFVDGKLYESITGNQGYILLHSEGYSDGRHSIDIVVTTHSGSGSLADLVGAEGFQYLRSWNFNVANSPPVPVTIKRIYNNNGALTIEWSPYTLFDFDKYEVQKTNYFVLNATMAYSNDPNVTSFEDLSFVGGAATYRVRVYSKNGSFTDSPSFAFADSVPVISSRWIKGNQIELSWPECNYPKAFQRYNIDNMNNINDKYEIYEINTTSLTGNYGVFGLPVTYSFNVKSQSLYSSVVSTTSVNVGEPFVPFKTFLKNDLNQNVLLSSGNTLYRYDMTTNQVVNSVYFQNGVPSLIYSASDDVLLETNPLQKRNPVTFGITGTFPGQSVLSTNLSGNSWGLAILNGNTVLYDYINMTVVSTLNFNSPNVIQISNDNQYIFELVPGSSIMCYKIDGNNVIQQWSKACKDFTLVPGKPDQVIIFDLLGNASVTEIATNKVVLSFQSFGYTANCFKDIDFASKTLVIFQDLSNPTINLFNYETGQLLNSIKCVSSNVRTKNGKLFISGRSITVN